MVANTTYKKTRPSSTYVYKIDPKWYFNENPNSTSISPKGVNTSKKKTKVAKKASQSNDPIQEEEYEDSLLPPQDHRP